MNTKIVCTIGPASDTEEKLGKLLCAGMNIARFNMSHAWGAENVEKAKEKMLRAREVAKSLNMPIEIALDTKGPDVRIGVFTQTVQLADGQKYKFYFGDKYKAVKGDINGVFVPYEKLLTIVKVGTELKLNDGHVEMEITEIKDNVITCNVNVGGELKTNKSLAIPNYDLQLPFISPEDEMDFKMAISVGVEWIFASAVSLPQNVKDLRAFLNANGGEKVKIVSKIEDRIGLAHIDEIIKLSDGIMVARGGLGTDIGLDHLPAAQKLIISKTRKAKKPVINATEMMEHMVQNKNCRRSEASDVANAVWDGATHVMFSSETASGKNPVETVEFACKIIKDAEAHKEYMRK
jgi:pyruvate kinase